MRMEIKKKPQEPLSIGTRPRTQLITGHYRLTCRDQRSRHLCGVNSAASPLDLCAYRLSGRGTSISGATVSKAARSRSRQSSAGDAGCARRLPARRNRAQGAGRHRSRVAAGRERPAGRSLGCRQVLPRLATSRAVCSGPEIARKFQHSGSQKTRWEGAGFELPVPRHGELGCAPSHSIVPGYKVRGQAPRLKWLHLIGAAVLLGTGAGIVFSCC
jgi:hypothetical protein